MRRPVNTFGRSASGVRIVITLISGALTSGPKIDDTKRTAITAGADSGRPSRGSGTVRATTATAPSLAGSNLGASLTVSATPISEPAPNAAKKSPAMPELPSNCW